MIERIDVKLVTPPPVDIAVHEHPRPVSVAVVPVVQRGAITPPVVALTAAEDVGGHRVIAVNEDGFAVYADSRDFDTVYGIVGISDSAAVEGDRVYVRMFGLMEVPAPVLPGSPIYLGYDGLMTQLPPEAGALVCVASAISPTRIIIDIQTPITLE